MRSKGRDPNPTWLIFLIKRGRDCRGAHTQGKGHRRTQQEAGHLQTRERERDLRRNQICGYIDLRLLSLQQCKSTNFFCSSHSVCVVLSWRPSLTNTVSLGWAQEFAFLTSSQMMLMLLVWEPHFLSWQIFGLSRKLKLTVNVKMVLPIWVKLCDVSFFTPPLLFISGVLSFSPKS